MNGSDEKKPSPLAPTVLITPALPVPRGRERFRPRSRWERFFALENLKEMGGTLLVVVPLTLLIWIWAEREQTDTADPNVTLQLIAGENESAVIVSPRSGEIELKLSGPKGNLDRYANSRPTIKAALGKADFADNGERIQQMRVRDLVAGDQELARLGLTVISTRPEVIDVEVDRYIVKDLPLQWTGAAANWQATTVFEPATVRARGTRKNFNAAQYNAPAVKLVPTPAQTKQIEDARPGDKITLTSIPIQPLDVPGLELTQTALDRAIITIPTQTEVTRRLTRPLTINADIAFGAWPAARPMVQPEVLSDVELSGPEAVMALINDEPYRSRIVARVTLSRDELDQIIDGKTVEKTPEIAGLPPGVRASPVKPVKVMRADATSTIGN
jgi:hypothetical protein